MKAERRCRHPLQKHGAYAEMWLVQVASCGVQAFEEESLVGVEIRDGHWSIDVNELKAPEADAATGGRTESESEVVMGAIDTLITNVSAQTSPT